MRRVGLLFIILILLAGCEPEATPIALVNTPSSEAVATEMPTNPPNLRYGLFVNTEGYVRDLAEIESRAAVETVYESARYTDYDIVAAYGIFEGWQVSPVSQHLGLVINSEFAPLDNEMIRALIPQAIDSAGLVAELGINGMRPNGLETLSPASIRTTLANSNYPDGLQLTLATSPIPALELILEDFRASNIHIQLLEEGNPAHLSLHLWTTEAERAALGEAIEIYSLPISYVAREGIQLEFSETGWPLPLR